MAQEAIAFAAPGTEQMTKLGVGTITGVGAGVIEGTVVMFSKRMGALEPILTWAALLGVPALGIAGALFTRGMLGDASLGVAIGGTAVLGYSLPAMLAPELFAGRPPAGGGPLGAGNTVKLLAAGPAAAAEAAAAAARKVGVKSSVEF